MRGGEGEQGKQGSWVWLKTQGCWRLPKAPNASWGPRKVPGAQGNPERLRQWEGVRGSKREQWGEGEQRKQGPWVWLKIQGCQRLPKASKASWSPRKVPGVQGGPGRLRGWEEVRRVRGSKGSKAPASDWRPKAAEGLQRLPRLPEASGRFQGPRKTQVGSGSEMGWEGARGLRGAREVRPLSLTEDPRPLKACKGSQGFLRSQEGLRDSGRLSWQGGARGSEWEWWVRGAREARPLCLTEDPRLPKASKGSQGFLRPQEVLRDPGRLSWQGGVRGSKMEVGGNGDQGGMFWGPYHLWGQFFGYPPLFLNQESLPLLPAFSPHSQLTEWR